MARLKTTGLRLRLETQLLHTVQENFSHGDARLFRNTVGEGWAGPHVRDERGYVVITRPSRIKFGLGPGTSDLVGWQTVTITPDMVGKPFAQFVAAEGKAPHGRTTDEQKAFIRTVKAAGGLAGVFRSEDDLRRILMGLDDEH